MMESGNYSSDPESLENYNPDDRYDITGESEFSRDASIPFDEDEVLSERHYNMGPLFHGKKKIYRKEIKESDHRGKGPRGYRKSDEAINEDVSEALYRSTEVDASEIEVTVREGIVSLKGLVDDRFQKKMAESAIEQISGVVDIYNELHIKTRYDARKAGPLVQNRTGMI